VEKRRGKRREREKEGRKRRGRERGKRRRRDRERKEEIPPSLTKKVEYRDIYEKR